MSSYENKPEGLILLWESERFHQNNNPEGMTLL